MLPPTPPPTPPQTTNDATALPTPVHSRLLISQTQVAREIIEEQQKPDVILKYIAMLACPHQNEDGSPKASIPVRFKSRHHYARVAIAIPIAILALTTATPSIGSMYGEVTRVGATQSVPVQLDVLHLDLVVRLNEPGCCLDLVSLMLIVV